MISYAILNFVDGLISLGLAALVASKGENRKIVRPFSYWTSAIALWSFGVGMHAIQDANGNVDAALIWSRLLHVGAVTIPSFFLHFVFAVTGKTNRAVLTSSYALTAAFLIAIPTDLFIRDVSPILLFNSFPKAGPIYFLFVLHFFVVVLYSLVVLFDRWQKARGIERDQTFFILIASLIGYTLGSTAFLPMFNVPIFPFGTPFVILNAVIIAYSIIRYRALDLNLVMRWGLAYSSSIVTLAVVVFVVVNVIESITTPLGAAPRLPTLISICIAAFFFQPLLRHISRFVDRFVFKSPDLDIHLKRLEKIVDEKGDLDSFAAGLSAEMKRLWQVTHAGLGVWDFDKSAFRFWPQIEFQGTALLRLGREVSRTDFLVKTLQTERRLFPFGIVIEDDVTALGNKAFAGERTTFWKIRRTMRWLNAAIAIPLMSKTELIGILVLGSKSNQKTFTNEDKKILSHIAEIIASRIVPNSAIGVP